MFQYQEIGKVLCITPRNMKYQCPLCKQKHNRGNPDSILHNSIIKDVRTNCVKIDGGYITLVVDSNTKRKK